VALHFFVDTDWGMEGGRGGERKERRKEIRKEKGNKEWRKQGREEEVSNLVDFAYASEITPENLNRDIVWSLLYIFVGRVTA